DGICIYYKGWKCNKFYDLGTVTTDSVKVTDIGIYIYCTSLSGNNSTIDERGICISSEHHDPTVTDLKYSKGYGSGNFTIFVPGLTENKTYFVRSYIITNMGTLYGNELNFKLINNINTFTDPRDGNFYKTLTIGNQTWMLQNLNYNISGSSCYNNLTANCSVYGRLYDWNTLMQGASASDKNPSGVQGICPNGWHIPSYLEWTILFDNLGGISLAGGKMKIEGTTIWAIPNKSADNSSGFTLLPTGYRMTDTRFDNLGYISYIWSTSGKHIDTYFDSGGIIVKNPNPGECFSVRCIKN
ncbi:MAG: FISUMP domain-containing protein, partial [Bacteroidota bacterium]|nr:FISUMP domain-containing protein [Bacteroidota bacterium]